MLRTRIAPTPSGLLHIGNAWSFVLTWLAARAQSSAGKIHLRIDDLDAERVQDPYVEDIFTSLRWLGIDWDSGPRDAADFRAAHSQRFRLEGYRAALDSLCARGHAYVCTCSRAQLRDAGPLYPGTCRARGLNVEMPEGVEHALRFRVPGTAVTARDLDGSTFALHPARDMGDFVLRRKNGDPCYQLASLLDDEALGINFVVRGLDLMPSTGAQLALAAAMDHRRFAQARFWHHPLIVDPVGEKLSKSRGAESLAALRARFPTPEPVMRWFAIGLGFSAEEANGVSRLEHLLSRFDPGRVSPHPLRLADFWRFVDSGEY
jgi:glutamyl/glutaminyl-tRNA synthetase